MVRRNCTGLDFLSLLHNPACPSAATGEDEAAYAQYRLRVLAALPELTFLDSTRVAPDELYVQSQHAVRRYRSARAICLRSPLFHTAAEGSVEQWVVAPDELHVIRPHSHTLRTEARRSLHVGSPHA